MIFNIYLANQADLSVMLTKTKQKTVNDQNLNFLYHIISKPCFIK